MSQLTLTGERTGRRGMSSVEVSAPNAREPYGDSADWWSARSCSENVDSVLQRRNEVADGDMWCGSRHRVALRQRARNAVCEERAQHAIVGVEPCTVGVRPVFGVDTDNAWTPGVEPRIRHGRDTRHRHLDDGNEDDDCTGVCGPKTHAMHNRCGLAFCATSRIVLAEPKLMSPVAH